MLSRRPLFRPLGTWEEPAIRWSVRQAIAQRWFSHDDEDDLTNACLLHWLEVGGAYELDRGTTEKTFLNRVTANYLIDLRRRQSYRAQRSVAFDAPIGDAGLTVGDKLEDKSDGPEVVAVVADLQGRTRAALSLLDGRDLEVALGLLDGKRVTDLSAALGISRQACDRARVRIAKIFRDQHLHEFLR